MIILVQDGNLDIGLVEHGNKINKMKRIVRLTESDLTRIVKRVIQEEEDAVIGSIESDIDLIDDSDPDPGLLQKIIDKIENAGHNVEDFVKKIRRGGEKFIRIINNQPDFDFRYKRKKPSFIKNFFKPPGWIGKPGKHKFNK